MSRFATDTNCVRLVYLSRMRPIDDPRWVINGILRDSHINNERQKITGALIFDRGDFGQILEGSRSAVFGTFLGIRADPRHFKIKVIGYCEIAERAFSGWSMGYALASDSSDPYAPNWEVPGPDNHYLTASGTFAKLHDAMLNNQLRYRAA